MKHQSLSVTTHQREKIMTSQEIQSSSSSSSYVSREEFEKLRQYCVNLEKRLDNIDTYNNARKQEHLGHSSTIDLDHHNVKDTKESPHHHGEKVTMIDREIGVDVEIEEFFQRDFLLYSDWKCLHCGYTHSNIAYRFFCSQCFKSSNQDPDVILRCDLRDNHTH